MSASSGRKGTCDACKHQNNEPNFYYCTVKKCENVFKICQTGSHTEVGVAHKDYVLCAACSDHPYSCSYDVTDMTRLCWGCWVHRVGTLFPGLNSSLGGTIWILFTWSDLKHSRAKSLCLRLLAFNSLFVSWLIPVLILVPPKPCSLSIQISATLHEYTWHNI
jgi:hypothetical protein